MKPLLIFLGGVHGVGKTSLAHELANRLGIYYHAGIGTLVQTLKTALPHNPVFQTWAQYQGLSGEAVQEKFLAECREMQPYIESIAHHAERSGEHYIFDGVQCLPGSLPKEFFDMFVITVSKHAVHRRRFEHPTKTKTQNGDPLSFETGLAIESILLKEAQAHDIPVIDNIVSIEATTTQIISLLRKQKT